MSIFDLRLKETALRLHPIVPVNGRVAVRDTTIPVGGGPDGKSPVFVKKGQIVVYNVYVMQRREDLYDDDADEFIPERWQSLRPGYVSILSFDRDTADIS
jgi:cytochrome P450